MNLTRGLVVLGLASLPALAAAQTVEIAPVGGYRFGGGFFERVTQQEVDLDGAPAVGLVVNVPLRDGLFVEALVTHQDARVSVPESAFAPAIASSSSCCALAAPLTPTPPTIWPSTMIGIPP